MSDFEAIIRWLVVLFAAGLAGLPIAAKLLGDSGRRAIWFARPIGLLAFFFPVWFLSSVVNLPFNRFFLVGSLIVVIAGGWYWYYRSGAFRNLSMREVFVAELVTLSAFLGAVWLRGFTPDIVGTEKPMDMAFLSSVIRSNQMPPPDPWMAGETINYYYIGYAIHGAVAKVAGVSAPIAFNLALVTTTALAIAAAIGCALVIAPRFAKFVAPLAGFFAIIAGNMDGPYRVLREGRSAWDASFGSGMGWQSSRVVYDGTIQTINEFPAFSIILGDLHPHLMTLPFTIVALAVAFGFVRNEGPVGWIQIGLAGVLGGALYGLNSWDLPTFFGLIVLALIWNSRSLPRRDLGLRVVGIGAVALIAWAPFIINFSPPVAGSAASLPSWLEGIPVVESLLTTVSVNNFEFTSAGEFLRVFGLFYALILAALLVAAKRLELTLGGNDAALTLGVPLALLVLIALLGNAPVFILVGVPAVLAVKILARSGPAGVEGAVAALFLAGALIIG
ncbi:MAG: hypothetical protein IT334_09835, partial [Thermomicrobiales bacterium]|nr:hypothetical protein [Thermomicrobiales bacterium]